MSLINQMLKDIEARRKVDDHALPVRGLPSGVASPVVGRRKQTLRLVASLCIGALAVGALLWAGIALLRAPVAPAPMVDAREPAAATALAPVPVIDVAPAPPVNGEELAQFMPERVSADVSEPVPVEPSVGSGAFEALPESAAVAAVSEPLPVPVAKVVPVPKALPVDAARLKRVRVVGRIDQPRLVADFDRRPEGGVEIRSEADRLVLRLPQTRFVGTLTGVPAGGGVRSIEVREVQDATELLLHLAAPCNSRQSWRPALISGGAQLMVDLYPQTPLPLADAPSYASKSFGEASRGAAPVGGLTGNAQPRALQPGGQQPVRQEPQDSGAQQLPGGEAGLRQSLALDPDHRPTRESLAALLLEQGRVSEVEDIYAEGVRRAGDHVPFRKGYARLLIDRGAFGEACSVLLPAPRPALNEDPEYYALIAAAQQRLGQYADAAGTYRRMVEHFPEAGTWWMGLGIALESEGQRAEASAVYRQALATRDLRPELVQYVRQRLAALNN